VTYTIYANLDQEARWSGLGLPAHVATRISYASSLLAALAPDDEDVEIWAPAAVDPSHILLPRVTMRVGTPPKWNLAWADPDAKEVNDRRFALEIAREVQGVALPGTRVIESPDDLGGEWPERWIAKAVWTAAGRDRARGHGPPAGEVRARVRNLVARAGAVVVEPWLDRIRDLGVCSFVGSAALPPHTLLTDVRGGFVGIDAREPELPRHGRELLDSVVALANKHLERADYRGAFTIDAFVYPGPRGPALHAMCELNARYTFGHVARALGCQTLGFGVPPAGARVLVGEPFTAWVA
jgi:hypothetical protein